MPFAPARGRTHQIETTLGSEPLRIQAERPVLSTTGTAIAPLLIGPVNLPGLLKGRAYLEQYDSGALAIRITCVNDAPGREQFYGLFSIRPAAAVAETLRPWEFLAHVRGENAQLVQCA